MWAGQVFFQAVFSPLPRAIDVDVLYEDVEEEGEEEQQRNRSEDDDEPTEDGAPTKPDVGKEH